MDSFEINKILGAVLGTCLVLLAVHIASGAIFPAPVPAKPGYVVEVKQEQPTHPGTPAAPAVAFDTLLSSGSAQHGAQLAKQCEICHNFSKGQGPKIGPDLYGVVGRKIASVEGFNYSSALKEKTGTWTFDELNKWLLNPRTDVPGTAMTFAGVTNDHQRADIVAYLNSNSDHPLALPKAVQAAPAPGNPSAAANPPAGANPPAATAPGNPPAAAPAKPAAPAPPAK